MKTGAFFVGPLIAATVATPRPVIAQGLNDLAYIATINGTCRKLVIGGADASRICKGTVVNAAYKTGRSSFQFVAADKAVVSFYGMDSRAKGDQASLNVEKVTLNLMMGTPSTSAPASGTCTYTNPNAGPTRIQCSAVSGGKTFSAAFVSDGREPVIEKF